MTEKDRDFLIEIVSMNTGFSKEFCRKMQIKELEQYYFDILDEIV